MWYKQMKQQCRQLILVPTQIWKFNQDDPVRDAQRTIFWEIFYFGPYRDHCITIWTKEVDKIDLLLDFLNSLDENLKFTVTIGGKSLCFINLKITIDDKKFVTSVYSKSTNSHLYFDGTWCHPTKSIDEISTGVANDLNKYASMTAIF